ncbi:MAG: M23 family metallopeptidase [Bacteroidales bacterium]|nr:M23 family metallopeptidase [Bacteroidales bacterium]
MGRQNIRAKLSKIYRLTLVEDKTHERKGALKISALGAIIWGITVVVIIYVSTYCLIAFTPLHSSIPGYPDEHSKRVAVANAIKIDSLENAITRWEIYSDNLSRILVGEETVDLDSIIKGNMTKYLSDKSMEYLQSSDSLLRETLRDEERFALSHSDERTFPIDGLHFFCPVKGVVTKTFSAVNASGISISSADGAVISASLPGTVISTAWDPEEGYTIIIQHSGEIIMTFSGCRSLLKHIGDSFEAGAPVATSSGVCQLTLWYKGKAVDPEKYINF